MNSGATWNLTGNATVSTLVNNGTINKNGYTLTYSSLSGSGTINETTGIESVKSQTNTSTSIYNLAGQRVSDSTKGFIIKDGKKMLNR